MGSTDSRPRPVLQANPYQAVRGQLSRDARRAMQHDFKKRLRKKPLRPTDPLPDDLADLFVDLITPHGLIRCIPITRDLDGRIVSEVSVRCARSPKLPAAGVNGTDPKSIVWSAPTWFELMLIRALAWPDEVEVVIYMAPAGDFRHLDQDAVHLRGPVPS